MEGVCNVNLAFLFTFQGNAKNFLIIALQLTFKTKNAWSASKDIICLLEVVHVLKKLKLKTAKFLILKIRQLV